MRPTGLAARLFVALQYLLPQRTLSRIVHGVARCRWRWLKNRLIGAFVRGYRPALHEAEPADPLAYGSFNEFFTRPLRAGLRPLQGEGLHSPVDGAISQFGDLDGVSLLQAKGKHFRLDSLLAGRADWCGRLRGGRFMTIYLAPFDYHRIHMPCAGTLRAAWHVAGARFSVNAATAAFVPDLFARNERVVCAFEGERGPFVLVLVGALFVGSIGTVWHGDIRGAGCKVSELDVAASTAALAAGAEMGRFNMGSTVILLLPPGVADWSAGLAAGSVLRLGQRLASWRAPDQLTVRTRP